jgi:hypothetical protein
VVRLIFQKVVPVKVTNSLPRNVVTLTVELTHEDVVEAVAQYVNRTVCDDAGSDWEPDVRADEVKFTILNSDGEAMGAAHATLYGATVETEVTAKGTRPKPVAKPRRDVDVPSVAYGVALPAEAAERVCKASDGVLLWGFADESYPDRDVMTFRGGLWRLWTRSGWVRGQKLRPKTRLELLDPADWTHVSTDHDARDRAERKR